MYLFRIILAFVALAISSASAEQQAADSAAQAEMVAAYLEMMKPGPEHAELAKRAGTWEMELSFFYAPGAPPEVMKFSYQAEMILGGRFLESNSAMNKSIMGFDRRSGDYTLVSFDTAGTYYVAAAGRYDSTSGSIRMYGEDVDKLAGFTQKYHINYYYPDENTTRFEVIFVNPEMTGGQPEFKAVEAVARRKK